MIGKLRGNGRRSGDPLKPSDDVQQAQKL